jgi:hypothetical protein
LNFINNWWVEYIALFIILLWIEATKVLDVPWVAHVCPIFALEPVGSWDNYAAHDEGAFPWRSQFASEGLDPAEY